MKTIASFTIDRLRLLPGIYVSRVDSVGSEVITTFDLRLTRPNHEPVMNTAEVHTSNIWQLPFCATMSSMAAKSSTLALWAAGPAFIFCWPVPMSPEISSH